MNKRLNSVLFVLGATVVNILLMLLVFFVMLILFARFVAPALSPQANQLILFGLFIASVVITYVIYHFAMRAIAKRVPLEDYFGPLFTRARRK